MSAASEESAWDDDTVARCIALLESFAEDRSRLALLGRTERNRLLVAAGRVSRPERDEQRRLARAFRKRERALVFALDKAARATTEIRAARRAEVFVPPPRVIGEEGPPRELTKPRLCYVCKTWFTRLHFFYDAMCPPCAALNYEKRFQTARLDGRVALVTGARLKIGYQAALMILRAGARVIVTTRFPRDAAARYAREPDFEAFRDRLEVHGLDLRHAPSVEIFARYVSQSQGRLDILINNAAQTVRRPPGFYAHLLEEETKPWSEVDGPARQLLARHESVKREVSSSPEERGGESEGVLTFRGGGDGAGVGIRASALLSQLASAYDAHDTRLAFPEGARDADLQQVDLRAMNSWRLTLADVPSAEMLEVHLVNAVAPFILCAKLKGLMTRDRTDEKHIVNVSAMEGQFARRTKTDKHPHTNMAKAALNMMTLTSAPDYAKSGIFMNAVDTGWVTDEDPAVLSERKREALDFEPPLDIVDGAARICDPFFSGLITGKHRYGLFFKDYAPAPW